jgi:hypothetical protein
MPFPWRILMKNVTVSIYTYNMFHMEIIDAMF